MMMNQRFVLRLAILFTTAAAVSSCLDVPPPTEPWRPIPAPIDGSLKFASLTAGDLHSCGLTSAGAAYCWGLNTQGQAGTGFSSNEGDGSPRAVVGGFTFAGIYAGGSHSCGLQPNGSALCWGNNAGGQLGDASTVDRFSPAVVAGNHVFSTLSASTLAHTCAVTTAGAAYCWGFNQFGALGDGTTASRTSPTLVGGGIAFASVTTGGWHTCGLTPNGTAYCWGSGAHGALGNGSILDRGAPMAVSGGLVFSSIVAGLNHTCGLTVNDGLAYCWGENIVGALGDGTNTQRNQPVAVSGQHDFTSLVAGERHICGNTGGSQTLCWGYNANGALGDGTLISRPSPVPLVSLLLFVKLAAGGYHTCGIVASGTTYCWGDNSGRQLGSQ